MASVAMLIGGALVNALGFSLAVVICSIDYLQTTLMLRERNMMQR